MIDFLLYTLASSANGFLRVSAYYFIVVNGVYGVLMTLAIFSIRKRKKISPFTRQLDVLGFSPAITVIAPAYNEEMGIVDSIKSLLHLQYSKYEVIVVNDGSKDKSMERLTSAFYLYPVPMYRASFFSSSPVHQTYRSKVHSNLIVIDKPNSGKADSLNVAIEYATYNYICAIDADSVLDQDALLKVAAPFIENPATVASGGTIRVANGTTIKNSRVVKIGLAKSFLPLIQTIEYIRSFFCGRVGWNALNATLIISGAFGLFKKESLVAVKGYRKDVLGEDMDLIVRLHRHYRKLKQEYSIVFLPDPVCWTEVPSDWMTLYRQRKRWQIGLAQSLLGNSDIFFNGRYGILGWVAFPYMLIFDFIGPVIETLTYVAIIFGVLTGTLSHSVEFFFFMASVMYGTLISLGAMLIHELFYPTYKTVGSVFTLILISVAENFGYRQVVMVWRLLAIVGHFKGNATWGPMKRVGFKG